MQLIEPQFPIHVGACVYCGRRDLPLSDEHVIPYGLDGTWKLREASCTAHATMTSRFEGEVLRHAYGAARAAMGLRTRRRDERPASYPAKFATGASATVLHVPISDHPGPVVFPIFAPPGVVPPNPAIAGTSVIRLDAAYRSSQAQVLAEQAGATGIVLRYPEPIAFARVVAKIAYCFAVGCVGYKHVSASPILPALLSEGPQIFAHVGIDSSLGTFTSSEALHDIALAATDTDLYCFVRLFADLHAPEYIVRLGPPPKNAA